MNIDMNCIFVFQKQSGAYAAKIKRNQGNFFLAEKNTDKHRYAAIEKILLSIQPTYIRGVTREKEGIQEIIDTQSSLPDSSPLFWVQASEMLSKAMPDYYFIPQQEPITWERIEREIGGYLGSGMLDEHEYHAITARLSSASEKEFILMHALLQRMHAIFQGFEFKEEQNH